MNKNRQGFIPEIKKYDNQTLQLLLPSKKCHKLSPRTLYFSPMFRKKKLNNKNKINIINLKNKYKQYFVTYYIKYKHYESIYLNILQSHGLLRSYYKLGNHNLFIEPFNEERLKLMRKQYGINKYQKIYHYINTNEFFDKDLLYKNYKIMHNLFKEDYNYMPDTFYYPYNKKEIETKFTNYVYDVRDLWLIKPINWYGGSGIIIFRSLKEIPYKSFILTKYITNVHLIKKRKYDLRLYVLVTGLKPLRIYFYKQGLVRIATELYSLDSKSINNKYIHLTNTAINMKNKNYIFPRNSRDTNANIWNLKTYKDYLRKNNINYKMIFNKIKDIIIKTIISGQNKLIMKNDYLHLNDRSLFNLFGFDILISDNLEPILLEVNIRPSLSIYNNVDKYIKPNIFIDSLNIIGIIPFLHKGTFESLDKEFKFKNNVEDLINNAFCELTRPRGDYELIFPLKKNINKYKKFFINNNEENIKFWQTIFKNHN